MLYLVLTLIGDLNMDGHPDSDVPLTHSQSDSAHGDGHGIHHGWTPLDLLGIGRAPLGVIMITMVSIWSLVGILLVQTLGYQAVILSIIVAAIAVIGLTGVFARMFGRLIPSFESYAQTGLQFWGAEGVVRYTIRTDAGTVQIKDRYGNTLDLECRLSPGQEVIPPHIRVRIEDFDAATSTYRVEMIDLRDDVSLQQKI